MRIDGAPGSGLEPATPGLDRPIRRKNTESTPDPMKSANKKLVCVPTGLAMLVKRCRKTRSEGRAAVLASGGLSRHPTHRGRRSTDSELSLPATGATRGPVRGVWGRGGGVRPKVGGIDAPWAGEWSWPPWRWPPTCAWRPGDRGRASAGVSSAAHGPAKRPLRMAPTGRRRPSGRSRTDRRSIRPHRSSSVAPSRPARLPLPCRAHRSRMPDRRPPRPSGSAMAGVDLFHDQCTRLVATVTATAHLRPPGADPFGDDQRRLRSRKTHQVPATLSAVPEHRPRPDRPSPAPRR